RRRAESLGGMEPPGLVPNDGKRPDGVTLIPWTSGRFVVWDFTCPDTLALSHISQTSTAAGSATGRAEERKRVKYSGLDSSYEFKPVAIETVGAWGPEAIALS